MGDSGLDKVLYDETREHIIEMIDHIQRLNTEPEANNSEQLAELFRVLHTTKSAVLSMGRKSTAELVHRIEDLVQALRDGRLSLNRKMIKLLLSAGNYLEDIMEVAETDENMKLLYATDVFRQLCDVVAKTEIATIQKEQYTNSLVRLGDVEESILRKVSATATLFVIHIRLSEECAYPGIRVWMCLQDVESIVQIVASNPKKPTHAEFEAGNCNLESEFIDLVAVGDLQAEELKQQLTKFFVEVDAVYVGNAKLENGVLHAKYVQEIDEMHSYQFDHESMEAHCKNQGDGFVAELSGEKTVIYAKEFVQEILKDVEKSRLLISEERQQYSDDLMTELNNMLHHIRGISTFIEHDFIFALSKEAARLTEAIKKTKFAMDDYDRDVLRKALSLIHLLCEHAINEEAWSNEEELIQHCELLRECSDKNESRVEELMSEHETTAISEEVELSGQTEQLIDQGTDGVLDRYVNVGNVLLDQGDRERELSEFKRASFIKVPAIKVDQMIKIIEEMNRLYDKNVVQAQASAVHQCSTEDLFTFSQKLKELTELARLAGALRVIEIGQAFQMVQQVGWNTARELGKNVEITINGAETTIDSGIADRIHNSLMHLIKNAVDHGIEESEAKRKELGKNPKGTIQLSAWNEDLQTIIEVADDGRGISLEKVYEKAVERGLIAGHEVLSEDQIMRFIFIPGFSTREGISKISGRGVGMNVVEEEIKKFGGRLEIITEIGVGTAFRIKIPVN